MKHEWTSGPWSIGEYSDTLGYDCMSAGIRVGPVVLDGADYGQERCVDMETCDERRLRMMADARLIAEAPNMALAIDLALLVIADLDVIAQQALADVALYFRSSLQRIQGEQP